MSESGFGANGSPIGKGYVQIYTGNSKGKTTAALGHGLKTYIGQFIKKHRYGEVQSARLVRDGITIEQYDRGCFIYADNLPSDEDFTAAGEGLARAKEIVKSGGYDIIVLDEILTACHFKLVSPEDILALVSAKPDGLEMVITERYAPEEIIAAADLVTEMKEVKHYYIKGVPARTGIER